MKQDSQYKIQLTIHKSLVYDCLRISMKLQILNVIFVLGIVGLARTTNGLCLVRNSTSTPKTYWYQCFRSNNYLADLNRAPVDVYGHAVANSKIRVIKNGSYARLSKSLVNLAIIHCGVQGIEDNAFQGLTKLSALVLVGNKLEVIKSAWFEGLSSLTAVSFRSNRIKSVDQRFFSILPPLNLLDISDNQLTSLPATTFGTFNAGEFHFQNNPLTWMCQLSLMNWSQDIEVMENCPDLGIMDPHRDIVKICAVKLSRSLLNEEFLSECAKETTSELLPSGGYYTVKQMCEFLNRKPSPFLNCN